MLADFVEVEPACEKATEEFLHEELEYVVVQNWSEAERGIDMMRADFDGRATFLVHPEPDERGIGRAPGMTPTASSAALATSALHQRLRAALRKVCFRGWRVVSWSPIEPRRSAFRSSIRIVSSCCRMASAITATR